MSRKLQVFCGLLALAAAVALPAAGFGQTGGRTGGARSGGYGAGGYYRGAAPVYRGGAAAYPGAASAYRGAAAVNRAGAAVYRGSYGAYRPAYSSGYRSAYRSAYRGYGSGGFSFYPYYATTYPYSYGTYPYYTFPPYYGSGAPSDLPYEGEYSDAYGGNLPAQSDGYPYGSAPLISNDRDSDSSSTESSSTAAPDKEDVVVRRKDTPAYITARVPAKAELWFDGVKTRSTGLVRKFQSPALTPGTRYAYTIRARWKENGRTVTQTRRLTVEAGENIAVRFPLGSGSK
jgi:uncharacterized protein (TIGR03000 family)